MPVTEYLKAQYITLKEFSLKDFKNTIQSLEKIGQWYCLFPVVIPV